jgi:hypothetical protein
MMPSAKDPSNFDLWRRIWKSWAPGKCQFFIWLVAHDCCWTADRLARRNLLHPELCPLCDQEKETINHILSSYVFAREFLFLLRRVGLAACSPQASETNFQDWWHRASTMVSGSSKKGLNSLIILGAYGCYGGIGMIACLMDHHLTSLRL